MKGFETDVLSLLPSNPPSTRPPFISLSTWYKHKIQADVDNCAQTRGWDLSPAICRPYAPSHTALLIKREKGRKTIERPWASPWRNEALTHLMRFICQSQLSALHPLFCGEMDPPTKQLFALRELQDDLKVCTTSIYED